MIVVGEHILWCKGKAYLQNTCWQLCEARVLELSFGKNLYWDGSLCMLIYFNAKHIKVQGKQHHGIMVSGCQLEFSKSHEGHKIRPWNFFPWSDFFKSKFTKLLGPSLGVNWMWTKRYNHASKHEHVDVFNICLQK